MTTHSCQQFELYAAEAAVPKGRSLRGVEELQAWVDELRESDYWQRNFSQVHRIDCVCLPGGKSSVGAWQPERCAGQIEMLPCHMDELSVIHEVCHVLCSARYGRCGHNPWFARTYLELTYTVLGSDAYAALRDSFERGGIDHDTCNANPAAEVAL